MIKDFFRKPYQPLNRVLVSKSAILNNLAHFRALNSRLEVCPVLKSNAYGHGLVEVARILDREKCPYFILDSLYEAQLLKKAGIKTPVLILGYQNPANLRKGLKYTFTAYDLASLQVLIRKKLPFHLELDTGMKRMGLNFSELPEAMILIKENPALFKGIFSHLMTADSVDKSRLLDQEKNFKSALELFEANGLKPRWIHLGNTAGTKKLSIEANMARLGIGLYGINPYAKEDPAFSSLTPLIPALKIESTLVAVRDLKAGEAISYGAQFVAPSAITIGIIPFGYYEGLPISLSDKGWVQYKGKDCPIVGRINMNHTFIDVTGLRANVGDSVEFYTNDLSSKSSVSSLAGLAGTIPYELLVRISPTIRRIVE